MTYKRIRTSLLAGLAGSAVHFAFMGLKAWTGLLPSFRPYEDLQRALVELVGASVPAAVPWLISFANGTVVLGFLFARTYRLIPGRGGAAKGFVFGVLGWLLVGLVFLPLLGQGAFAVNVGLGPWPGILTLAMVLTYSIVLGIVDAALRPQSTTDS